MDTQQHTPGPWWHDGRRVFAAANCHATVATVGMPHDDRCQANTRLIVAAPTLLEAAKRALAFAEAEAEARAYGGGGDDYEREPSNLAAELRAAIGKATGGAA